MPIYFYWGEDDLTLNQAVHHLRDHVLDFSGFLLIEKISGDQFDATQQAFNQLYLPI